MTPTADGTRLAFGFDDGTVAVLDTQAGGPLEPWTIVEAGVHSLR